MKAKNTHLLHKDELGINSYKRSGSRQFFKAEILMLDEALVTSSIAESDSEKLDFENHTLGYRGIATQDGRVTNLAQAIIV